MTTEKTVTKRLGEIEERLDNLEKTTRQHKEKTATLSRQTKRIKTLIHRATEQTEANRDELKKLGHAVFHLNRRSYANKGHINYLLKKIENRDTESKP